MKKTLFVLAAALMSLAPMQASAAVRGYVGVGFGHPYFYGSYWGPGWGPYWGPWGPVYGGYYALPATGELKIDTKVKNAQVFINGSYAGTLHDNKNFHLRPGNYKLEIRQGGQTQFAENVYVTAGKTLKIRPELIPDQRQQN